MVGYLSAYLNFLIKRHNQHRMPCNFKPILQQSVHLRSGLELRPDIYTRSPEFIMMPELLQFFRLLKLVLPLQLRLELVPVHLERHSEEVQEQKVVVVVDILFVVFRRVINIDIHIFSRF